MLKNQEGPLDQLQIYSFVFLYALKEGEKKLINCYFDEFNHMYCLTQNNVIFSKIKYN